MWSRFVKSQVKHNSYFLCGVALGLWISLVAIPLDEEVAECGAVVGPSPPDEYTPEREERPLGPAGQASGRSVQRPRYYSTELGMRGSLLSGVLTSEGALAGRVSALNKTMQTLQPALKFFITASEMSNEPGLANVVGFTDTREMLKPFHALKYLADNYLEEFDFFFLVSDGAFVNARRLAELVSKLSVSQELYMGTLAEDDSHYCSLDSGIIISNSVLRAVHSELDWCVRNSYSPHHHENLGRCVLHAAHLSCTQMHQGELYQSVRLANNSSSLQPSLADAVAAHPAAPADVHRLHAYVSRVWLERGRASAIKLRGEMWHLAGRHPANARNATWPAGLRSDPGLQPPTPPSRFDHLRWTLFNATHAFMPDEHRAVGLITAPTTHAVQLVVDSAVAWARQRWAWATKVELSEGAWQWAPPTALRYRLLLKLYGPDGAAVLRSVEVARALGAARLVPVRYVTESARVNIVLPLPLSTLSLSETRAFLERYTQLSQRDANTNLYIVTFTHELNKTTALTQLASIREALTSLSSAQRTVELIDGGEIGLEGEVGGEEVVYARAGRSAVRVAGGRVAPQGLVLVAVPHLEFNQDFLNRVRMNCVPGAQWFLPLPFSRHAAYARAPGRTNTGRFNVHSSIVAAFYKGDYDDAVSTFPGLTTASPADVLAARPALRALRAPDPAALRPPRPAPCPAAPTPACPRQLALGPLALGARHTLAQLLLETHHENEMKAN